MEYEFQPRTDSQKEIMEDRSPCLLYCAPWYAGKTHVGAVKAYAMGSLYNNNCIALVRKKRVDLKPTLWKKFVDEVLPPGAVVASNDSELYRKMVNGTEFYGVGLDSTEDVNKLASREYGFIVAEEIREIKEDDFDEKLLRCLRLPSVPFHQLLGLTNAGSPSHFLYKRFYMEKWGGYRAVNGEMLPDPPKNYQAIISTLRGVIRQRYIDNKWVSFEGLVYPFDPMKHVITEYNRFTKDNLPKDWKRVLSVDFGFDHPFVCHWWAVTPADVWLLYRQIYMSRRRVQLHAKDIVKFCEIDDIEPIAICDHDAENRATLESEGIITVPANKARLAGQQTVFGKFENDQIYFFQDSLVELDTRLLMEKKPTKTEDEYPDYIWANKAKEDMVKEKDDGMDAKRYAIHTTEGDRYTEFRVRSII